MYRKIIFGVIGMLGFVSVAFAGSYYSPERITCKIENHGQLHCDGIDRTFLMEEFTNADIQMNHGNVFNFVAAVAYVSSQNESTIFYTYSNADHKIVKLRTANTSIQPDFKHGRWIKFNDDIYTCDAGYMSCPVVV